jgi:hypothetical protein
MENSYTEIKLSENKTVFQCDDCGAYASLPEQVGHYPDCKGGESKRWKKHYDKYIVEKKPITEEQRNEYLGAKTPDKHIETINSMSQIEMARLWRFAPVGHPYFDSSLPYCSVFIKRFTELGGMTPEISKIIGLK